MQHTDKSVAVLNKLFGYWFDKASWHRPTLLVFDNMESLFGVELEVPLYFAHGLPSLLIPENL
jgi:hypothetical protein